VRPASITKTRIADIVLRPLISIWMMAWTTRETVIKDFADAASPLRHNGNIAPKASPALEGDAFHGVAKERG
jgi:hypothetical protein